MPRGSCIPLRVAFLWGLHSIAVYLRLCSLLRESLSGTSSSLRRVVSILSVAAQELMELVYGTCVQVHRAIFRFFLGNRENCIDWLVGEWTEK